MQRDLLQIGVICRAHGLRGELRVRLHDPSSQALDDLRTLWVAGRGEEPGVGAPEPRAVTLKSAREQPNGEYLVMLDGVSDRTQAERLHGCRLYARRSELQPLDEDEFYVADLVGCTVALPDGTVLGVASAVAQVPGNELLVVPRAGRGELLIPIVPELLVEVDVEGRRVVVEPPSGLLDLDLDAREA